MKIFLSWSGPRSHAVAKILKIWIKCVIQATRPWLSSSDLDRGSIWFNEISNKLQDTNIGIVCLTRENKDRPWILFEAGALAKGLTASRVCTFLIDLQTTEIKDPLAQFNHTMPTKEGLLGLIHTINNSLGNEALEDSILQRSFETYWPQFEEEFKRVLGSTLSTAQPESIPDSEILSEILNSTRQTASQLRRLEQEIQRRPPPSSLDGKPNVKFSTSSRGPSLSSIESSPTSVDNKFLKGIALWLDQNSSLSTDPSPPSSPPPSPAPDPDESE